MYYIQKMSVSHKLYVTPNELLRDSYKLGKMIHESGFQPTFIVGIWRGGSPIGIAVQEFLKYKGHKTGYISGGNYQEIREGDSLLIIDDIFDSGSSVKAVIDKLTEGMLLNIQVAALYYKPQSNKNTLVPTYFVHSTDKFVVFPHQFGYINVDEIRLRKGDEVAEIFDFLI